MRMRAPLVRIVERSIQPRRHKGEIAIERLTCGHTWIGRVPKMHGMVVGPMKRRCFRCMEAVP